MINHLKSKGIIRFLAVGSLALTALAGCLPEYDEPPLTATGEGGESLTSSSSSSSSGTPSCSGAVSGSIPGSTSVEGQIPCTLQGSVDARTLTPSQRTQVSGIKVIKGSLTVSSAEQIGYFKALTSVDSLSVLNYGGGTLELPSRIAVTNNLVISGGTIATIKGFAGVQNLSGQLSIENITGLTSFNAFGALVSADTLRLNKLSDLVTLQGFGNLSQLKTLQIIHMTKLTALPALSKVKTMTTLMVGYNPELTTINVFSGLTNTYSLQLMSLPKVASVSFPALMTVGSLYLDGVDLLNDLEGFGSKLVVSSEVHICNILMKADQRELWRQKHAPNLQFSKCANGCIGMGC